jgi:hypothetical protein
MSLCNSTEYALLNHLLGGPDFTRDATVYFGLFTTLPDEAEGNGVEVTGGSYARVAVTNNSTNFPAATSGQKTNGTEILFPAPTANWGTVVGVGVFTAPTGGTLRMRGLLDVARTINNGSPQPRFQTNAFKLTLD